MLKTENSPKCQCQEDHREKNVEIVECPMDATAQRMEKHVSIVEE